ncbi:hypothetical protein QZH41_020684 [Actinostola sp. cb2023]|nr:hypothetical protein QZH41_020684 [Actinostola sp. cb2023]
MDQGKTPVIIAHNGFKFDFPVLANSLKRFNLLEYFLEVPCLFVDSLVLLRQQSKQKEFPIRNCKSKNITTLYRFLFDKEFSGHDATEDVKALISILYDSRLTVTHTEVLSLAKEFKDFAHDEAACKIRKVKGMELMQIGLSSSMSDKIVDSGMTYGRLKDVYRQKRLRGLLTALALPGSFCIFNYNISVYTFLTVFAYVGGLVVFLSTFYRIVMHYLFRLVFLFVGWVKRRRSGPQQDNVSNSSGMVHVQDGAAMSPYDYMNETDDSLSIQEPQELPSVSGGDLVDAMT